MNLSALYLLHLYDYQKTTAGNLDPLSNLKKDFNPLILSTCMRHLYLFSEEQVGEKRDNLENFLREMQTPKLHQKMSKIELLQGTQAYEKLLFWVIGGLNPKKPFNDERILGDLRKTYQSYENTSSPKRKVAWEANKPVILALLADGKNLLALTKELAKNDNQKELLEIACKNCTWARENGFLPFLSTVNYAVFVDQGEMIAHFQELLQVKERKTLTELRKHSANQVPLSFLFSEDPAKFALQNNLDEIVKLKKLLNKITSEYELLLAGRSITPIFV
ncbi:hypothetical protein [Legionella cardiaca]|uniref:Ankyrin repeat protein n=1 Tax=Legionella cardiaca TaxID=1071983 RepID=A0ABY8APB6_9GAMM|nr:hypothetical protein [Legionella cardiaca]WED42545.1 hypothetical protein PXX05_11585 [Legionella cardiaca]